MRADKFLWCVRYYKTRNIATKACRNGRVRINGEIAKPSKEIFPSDIVEVRKNQIDYKFEVLDLPPSRRGAKWVNLYINDITPKENLEKLDLLRYEKSQSRAKGLGRPTKKDRRELEDWYEEKASEWFEADDDNQNEIQQ